MFSIPLRMMYFYEYISSMRWWKKKIMEKYFLSKLAKVSAEKLMEPGSTPRTDTTCEIFCSTLLPSVGFSPGQNTYHILSLFRMWIAARLRYLFWRHLRVFMSRTSVPSNSLASNMVREDANLLLYVRTCTQYPFFTVIWLIVIQASYKNNLIVLRVSFLFSVWLCRLVSF